MSENTTTPAPAPEPHGAKEDDAEALAILMDAPVQQLVEESKPKVAKAQVVPSQPKAPAPHGAKGAPVVKGAAKAKKATTSAGGGLDAQLAAKAPAAKAQVVKGAKATPKSGPKAPAKAKTPKPIMAASARVTTDGKAQVRGLGRKYLVTIAGPQMGRGKFVEVRRYKTAWRCQAMKFDSEEQARAYIKRCLPLSDETLDVVAWTDAWDEALQDKLWEGYPKMAVKPGTKSPASPALKLLGEHQKAA
jgi:hypothetical protein